MMSCILIAFPLSRNTKCLVLLFLFWMDWMGGGGKERGRVGSGESNIMTIIWALHF